MERETTIRGLFIDIARQFVIPPYQRAFSWDKDKQVKQFINDLQEQDPEKKYYLGHFLFENDEEIENKYYVIDGQQRLTTIVIFFSCLIKTLEEKKKVNVERLLDSNGEEVEPWRLKETYLQIKNKRRLRTVEYDDNFFENLISDRPDKSIETSSQRRIKEAFAYFNEIMETESVSNLIAWKEILENAVVTTFEVADKALAVQIFAFQNDRGKTLTELEKLKAYLMHRIYLEGPKDGYPQAINFVEAQFESIYKQTEKIDTLEEDQVLRYFSLGFLERWEAPLENVKEELARAENKEHWIKILCTKLKNVFYLVEQIETVAARKSNYMGDCLILNAYNSWPLILKLYYYHYEQKVAEKNELEKVGKAFRLMEIILFKMEYSYGDYRTNRFNYFAKHYEGNIDELLNNKLWPTVQEGFQPYWNFNEDFIQFLEGNHHYNRATRYLLWKYENYLRDKQKEHHILPDEFTNKFWARRLDYSIEHIAPSNPENATCSEEFRNKYLHNLGNLVLMNLGGNASESNNSPLQKAERFKSSSLLSQQEVGKMIEKRGKWTEEEIKERHESIVKFAREYWLQ